jgi:hypothetical protein
LRNLNRLQTCFQPRSMHPPTCELATSRQRPQLAALVSFCNLNRRMKRCKNAHTRVRTHTHTHTHTHTRS